VPTVQQIEMSPAAAASALREAMSAEVEDHFKTLLGTAELTRTTPAKKPVGIGINLFMNTFARRATAHL
jgi:hypothetical protein